MKHRTHGRFVIGWMVIASLWLTALPAQSLPSELGTEELPAKIDEVRIHLVSVLWKTRQSVVLRELPWKAGEQVTQEQWDLGIIRLWNTGLFSQINARIIHDGDKRVAVFDLEDRLTLNPLLKFTVEGGGNSVLPSGKGPAPTYWFHVGADDNNLFGTFLEAGFTYEMFGLYPGGRLWFHDPRLFNKRLDGWFEANYLPRPRPGFTLFRGMARAQVSYEVNDEFVVLGRADGILDRFIDPPAGESSPIRKPHASEGAILSMSVRIGRVDTVRLLQKNWSLEFQPSVGITDDPIHPTFTNGLLQFLGFIPVANRWNFALRVQAGVSSPAPAQDLLYIGGSGDSSLGGIWDHAIRGLLDNAITTNAFAMFNAEVRVIAFDSTWIALMPAIFVDGVVAAGNPLGTNLNGPTQRAVSVGGGVRVLIPRFVGTGLRLDGAYVIGEPDAQQAYFSVGVYQMF